VLPKEEIQLPAVDYARHVAQLEAWGYDVTKLRRVPHAPRS
jgi:hypothetical protein